MEIINVNGDNVDLKDPKIIASLIDHTILRPDASIVDVVQRCIEAVQYNFASVCTNSCYVRHVKNALTGTGVKTCSVVGFPLGATVLGAKISEARIALSDGADELDMVINIGLLKSKDFAAVRHEIESLVRMVRADGALLKVILETALLTESEKRIVCEMATRAGADFVKTSTGFSGGGATVADVAFMRSVAGPRVGVKASGEIKDLTTLLDMVAHGATRIGTSNGVPIMKEARALAGMP
jgi:deoxyribose-phosphate aldolase